MTTPTGLPVDCAGGKSLPAERAQDIASVVVADAAEAKRRKPSSKNSRSSADSVKISAEGPSDQQPERLLSLWSDGPTAWGFTRLVELPQCDEKFDPLECLRYRVELEPRWYRQQYAYLELKPEDQVSSSDR